MRRILILLSVTMLVTLIAFAQTRTVSGRVTDAQGKAVPFASVTIKGTTTGVAADENGNFSIQVAPSSTLVFSASGYQPSEVNIGTQTTINASLGAPSALSEVVVTALGITRTRNQVPYAAQQIGGNEVSQTRSSNFVNNLSGKVSGLEIRQNNSLGGSTNVLLRGAKSLTGNNQALFVIDGVPFDNGNNNTTDQVTGRGGYDYGNAAADINPDDIENITVLKGAAASALYGSRGSNGVILITTKKGKRGVGITLNTGVTRSNIIRSTFPKYQKKYGAGYGLYFDEYDVNGDGVDDLVAPTYDDASWGMKFDPNLLVYQWNAFDPSSPNFGKPTPWIAAENDPSYFFEKPWSFNNSIFLDAGSDKANFSLGYTRNNEKGILPNSSVNKDLLNISGSYKILDNLTAGASANYSRISGKGRYGTGYDGANALNLMTNFREWWQTNVDLKELKEAYERTGKNITWNMHFGPTGELQPEFWDNPYFTRYQSYETDLRNRYFGNVYLNYKPVQWLNVLGRISLDNYSELEQERKAVTSVGVPFYRRFNQDYSEVNYDLLGNANWDLTKDINLKALLGSNTRIQKRNSVDANTNGGLVAPGLYTISNSLNAPAPPIEFVGTRRVEGVFGGATFTYKNAYTLDATLRRDRSSTLPEANNVYYYPSVSGAVTISQLIKPSWLTYSKFRANYAEVGNDAPLYSVADFYVSDIDPNSGQEVTNFSGNALFSVSGTKNNPELKPERTKSFEVGLEMSMLRSRLGFDVAWYKAQTVDQILPLTVSTATGYTRKFVNSGTIQNKGVEVSLYGTPLKTRNFTWDINVNWTRNRNKVTELYAGVDNIVLASFQGSITVNATLNEPYGSIHGTDYQYYSPDGGKTFTNQKLVDPDGNYIISPTNNIVIGNVNPDWIGGVNNKFTYKGLSLSALIDVRKGGSVFNTDLYYALAGGLYEETAEGNIREPLANGGGIIREGVTADGKPNTTKVSLNDDDYASGPGSTYGLYDSYVSAPDKRFVYDAGYVKLREVALTYSFPSRMFGTNNLVKGVDVSLIGRNLAILHKNLPYADPEDSFGSGNFQGVQIGTYPAVRTVGINFKVKF